MFIWKFLKLSVIYGHSLAKISSHGPRTSNYKLEIFIGSVAKLEWMKFESLKMTYCCWGLEHVKCKVHNFFASREVLGSLDKNWVIFNLIRFAASFSVKFKRGGVFNKRIMSNCAWFRFIDFQFRIQSNLFS